MEDAMSKVDAQEYWDANVRSEETASGETTGEEHVETIYQREDDEASHSDVCSDRLD